MSPLLSMSAAERHAFLVDLVPFNRALNLQVVACEANRLVMDMPYDAGLVGNPLSRAIHEGAITTLIDTACGSVVLTNASELRRSATLDLRMDFLREARPGRAIRCEAHCLHMTDNVAHVRAVAHDGDAEHPLATATGCFAVFAQRLTNPDVPPTGATS